MSRLIDADELREHLFVGADYDRVIDDGIYKTEEEVFAFKCGWNDALKSVVQFAPTVDAVPVVRCKNCMYRVGSACDYSAVYVRPNGYCQWGRRKENETD